MINIHINKIDMFDDEEFRIEFTTRCDNCHVETGQQVTGPKMTRILVTCSSCKDTRGVDIIPEIENTVTNIWNYPEEDVEEVMRKLRNFKKETT